MVNPVFLFVLLQHNIHPYQCDLIHIVNMFKKIKLGGGGGGGGPGGGQSYSCSRLCSRK
jgi:hypothetical protein